VRRAIPNLILSTVAAALLAAPAHATELDLGLTAGGTAPLTEVLRKANAGADLALQLTYGVTPYLDLGLRYGLAIFPQDTVDAQGNAQDPILDHGVSAVLGLTLAAGSDAGWLEAPGSMAGDLWLDLGVGYHMIGRESRAGLDVALGYRLHVTRDWQLGPLFRVSNVFATSQGTATCVVFGIDVVLDFGRLIDGEPTAAEQPAPAPASSRWPAPAPTPAGPPAPPPSPPAT